MRRTFLALLSVLALLTGFSVAAHAHTGDALMWRPYVIVKTCNNHFKHCKARMEYARGQNPGTTKPGTYFYQKARKGRHDDFRLTASGERIRSGHWHKKHHHRFFGLKLGHHKHYKVCRNHGWGFDRRTGTFAWMPKKAKCLYNYDGP